MVQGDPIDDKLSVFRQQVYGCKLCLLFYCAAVRYFLCKDVRLDVSYPFVASAICRLSARFACSRSGLIAPSGHTNDLRNGTCYLPGQHSALWERPSGAQHSIARWPAPSCDLHYACTLVWPNGEVNEGIRRPISKIYQGRI